MPPKLAPLKPIGPPPGPSPEDEARAKAVFAEADTSGDGQIDRQEFASGLEKLNEARLAGAVPDGRANEAMMKLIMGQVNFHEVLYAVCERKTGKPLPNTNEACTAAKIKVGVLMPSINQAVLDGMRNRPTAIRTTPAMYAALAFTSNACPRQL